MNRALARALVRVTIASPWGLAIAALPACVHAPGIDRAPPAGEVHRFRVGELEAMALDDGALDIPNDGQTLGVGHSTAEVGDLLAAAGLPRERAELRIQPLLVRDGPHVLLFDAGAADASWARAGHLPRSLALAGVAPGDVTDVFISHANLDHIGGLVTATGQLAFANAVVHISQAEWTSMQKPASMDADARAVSRVASAIAPKVVTFEAGARILPEVASVATVGHTRGHTSYEISSNGEKLLYLGDVAHHFVVSVQRPAWVIDYDEDPKGAVATRLTVLASLARDGERVYSGHFPFPGLGHVQARKSSFVWVPEP